MKHWKKHIAEKTQMGIIVQMGCSLNCVILNVRLFLDKANKKRLKEFTFCHATFDLICFFFCRNWRSIHDATKSSESSVDHHSLSTGLPIVLVYIHDRTVLLPQEATLGVPCCRSGGLWTPRKQTLFGRAAPKQSAQLCGHGEHAPMVESQPYCRSQSTGVSTLLAGIRLNPPLFSSF